MTDSDVRSPAGSPAGREAILEAFLGLLAERSFETISLTDVAGRAGVSLSELRSSFGSTFDMLAGFVRATDAKVLAATEADQSSEMDDEIESTGRDRLFEVLMARLDALAPHKAAIGSLARSMRRNPMLALGLNRMAVRSQQWMLAAARIENSGLKGTVRAQGLAVLFARVLRTFVTDTDPGLARTMAELDRELAKGERALGLLCGVARVASCRGRRRGMGRVRPEDQAPAAAI
ncbi:TetR/AcrR family transcriptional regulator [Ancylobacter sp. 6x-1]|uniref:TetR/AcrR family transcriptional regulator n=1 Tax=Ancylobacter crimeensis TaxID=2579147 RepID=A0ABT0DA58_9HYPH|nr:TetR/AcrR family transcriptional regulator [Ancylobacter crimeensis]MCK0196682.1 TetR/AcrR family transcriptional regulator [Ancylobacter crimeensis]